MFIEVNGTNLFYEKIGSGRPLILLHGNSQDHTLFSDVVNRLSTHYTIYAVDSRDHGQSDPSPELEYKIMAEDTAEFIKILNLEKPAICGSSDGAIIAMILASRYPDLLSGLVLCGGNMRIDGMKKWFMNSMGFFYFLIQKSPNEKDRASERKLKLILDQPSITKDQMEKISVPTLVLAGSKDIVKESHTKEMASCIPNCKLKIVKGEGHVSYIKKGSKLCGIILPFLKNEKVTEYSSC